MEDLLLVRDNVSQSEADILELATKRKNVANALEAIRNKYDMLTGKKSNYKDLSPLFKLDLTDSKSLQSKVVELSEEYQKAQSSGLFKSNYDIKQSLKKNPLVDDLVAALGELWSYWYPCEEDLKDYWYESIKAFREKPITEEERDEIKSSHRWYAKSEQLKEEYLFLKGFADLVTRFNKEMNGTQSLGALALYQPWIVPFLRQENKPVSNNKFDKRTFYEIFVREDLFLVCELDL